jgi:hypothetical protein
VTLFNNGRGNNGRTGADLLSAVTDFYTHESSGKRGEMAQAYSSEMGASGKCKTDFFNTVSTRANGWAMDGDKLKNLADLGEKSLTVSLTN